MIFEIIQMKFGVHLLANLTPEWNSQYIQYKEMKELLEKAAAEAPNNDDGDDEEYFLRIDQDFFEVRISNI